MIRIEAFDDAGRRHGPVSLSVDAHEAVHFNSDDLAVGNPVKGLDGGVGRGQGDWRQRLTSALDIEVLAYMRTTDGFLTAMHDTVPLVDGRYWVPIFNPGSNPDQVSRLRLVNPGADSLEVSIVGIDDQGDSGGPVTVSLAANSSRTFTSAELESGTASGLDGALDTGAGKWQLFLDADGELVAMSLLESPSGHLTNLSTAPEQAQATPEAALRSYPVWLFPAASDRSGRRGFVRLINRSAESGDVAIVAIDDDGRRHEPVSLSIDARATVHFNAHDLESGNPGKGLAMGIGTTEAGLRLKLSTELDLMALSYVRTADGLVTAMHDTVVRGGNGYYRVPVFNPGRNTDQVSLLRLVNPGGDYALVTISGVDDRGDPSSTVHLRIRAGKTTTLSAAELEAGTGVEGGALGDGHGKWELLVESDRPLAVMSLLQSPTGHLTNLSTAPRSPGSVGEGVTRQFAENTGPGEAIGEPVTAAFRIEPTLDHALTGPDADAFAIDAETGQLKTRERATYDYETQAEYNLTVTVTGGTGRAVRIAVTVEVGDENEPPGQPSAPEVEGASTSSVRVSWTAPGNTGPEIDDYDVEYRRDGTDEFTDAEHEGTATETEIGSLLEGVDYEFRVRASNAEGVGEWSEPGSGRVTSAAGGGGGGGGGGGSTPPPPPPPPPSDPPVFPSTAGFTVPENTVAVGTVRASNATTHTLADSADGAAFEIDNAGALRFRAAPDYEQPTDVATSDPPDSARNNVYVVTVVATAGSGNSAQSARQTVTIEVTNVAEVPATPAAPTVSSTSANSLTAHWSEPATDGPLVRDYDLRYRVFGSPDDFTEWSHDGAGFVATIESLPASTEHEVQVLARNDDGDSAWSGSGRGTTGDTVPSVSQFMIVSDAGPDATYLLGDTIEVAATFTEPVVVDTTDGTPQIGLTVGSNPRTANYVRGSDRSVLAFAYEVVASDTDTDGVSVIANTLSGNSGTIRKRDSTVNATLTHSAVSDQSAHKVDGATTSTSRPGNVVETFPFVTSGTYANELQRCTYFSPSTESCNFSRLPFLGAETSSPSRADVLGRLLVSHRWMGENFRDMLAQFPYELRLLFRSVTAVVIASDINPAYYLAARGAIYLDPIFVALTPEQQAAISDEEDYRRSFGAELQFEMPWRFVRHNRWMRAHRGPDGSRSIDVLAPFLGFLLLHELAHAVDYIHPSRIVDFSDSEGPSDVANNQGSKRLSGSYPLTSDVMEGLSDVSHFGATATAAQKALLPSDLIGEFSTDDAMKYYSYATIREDFATAFDSVMMSFLFRWELDVGITDKGTQDTSADNVVAWGQRGRYGDPNVVHRVRDAVRFIYSDHPDIRGSVEAYIDSLPAPTAMRADETWLQNTVLRAGASQLPPPTGAVYPTPLADDILRTRLIR